MDHGIIFQSLCDIIVSRRLTTYHSNIDHEIIQRVQRRVRAMMASELD